MQARRILVAGGAGAGRTALARRIADVTGAPHVEIDGLYWRGDWSASTTFLDDVRLVAAEPAWVTEFRYPEAMPLLAGRAELLVWLRPTRATLILRAARRALLERLRGSARRGQEDAPPTRRLPTGRSVQTAIRTFHTTEERVHAAQRKNPALQVVQVRSGGDVTRLLALLAP